MKTIGIIAEFNPFHNGHKYLIEKAKRITKADNVVVVCSGNFVQRGEPAFFDKSIRAEAALMNGADVVLELPVMYSTASAETFAFAAVRLLDKLNCIDYLCFGCETDNIKSLPVIANILFSEPLDYKNMLSVYLKNGFSYPKARAKALTDYCNENNISDESDVAQILNQANNILAIEYLKALKKFHSSMKPLAIKRIGPSYNSEKTESTFASATGMRKAMKNNAAVTKFIPENCADLYRECNYMEWNDFSTIMGYKLIQDNDFSHYADISNDLANRIHNLQSDYTDVQSFIEELHAKNYTHAGISRSLTHILLNITQNDMNTLIADDYLNYARILGFRKNNKILSIIKEKSSLEIVSKFSTFYKNTDGVTRMMMDASIKADALYRMTYMNKYGKKLPTEFERRICTI